MIMIPLSLCQWYMYYLRSLSDISLLSPPTYNEVIPLSSGGFRRGNSLVCLSSFSATGSLVP